MKPVPFSLLAPITVGVPITVAFLGSWVAYFWGDGDGERAVVCTAFMVFAGPLLVGSVLALHGRRLGLHLLRFGAIIFIFDPITFFSLWQLGKDPEYIDCLSRRGG
jgi:hypothetical protein